MLSRAFDHICMEKAHYKFLIITIIIINHSTTYQEGSNGFLRGRALIIVISKDAGKQSPLISVLLGICYD